MKVLNFADLFCGAGGGSGAAQRAAALAGFSIHLTQINHWEVAIATIKANFPGSRPLHTGVDSVNPLDLFKRGELFALIGGPECIEFSTAAGGKPKGYQYRATPWCMVRWAEALLPEMILIENVPEFARKWPPYLAWLAAFEALGYRVSTRVLNAADYGDPTTRERLFIQCMRGKWKVTWAEPTHAPLGTESMFDRLDPWRSSRDHVIDWSLLGRWLDEMPGKKQYGGLPLSPKTMARIFAGLAESGFEPIIAEWDNLSNKRGARSVSKPLSTITSKARHGLAEPYFVKLRGTSTTASIDAPAPTITAGGNHLALVEAVLIHTAHAGKRRARKLTEPMPTVTGNRGDIALCEYLLPQGGGGALRDVAKPAPTIHGSGIALIEPFLIKYYGTAKSCSIRQPLPTVTTKDRFALLCPEVVVDGEVRRLRIRWRMLQPHELAAAQGFPRDYIFCGARRRRGQKPVIEPNANKGDIVKQIGNAWPNNLATALILAMLTQKSDIRPYLKTTIPTAA